MLERPEIGYGTRLNPRDALTGTYLRMGAFPAFLMAALAALAAMSSVACAAHEARAIGVSKADGSTDATVGRYSFAPGPRVPYVAEDDSVSANAVLIDDNIRWMTKADEGTLGSKARLLQVIVFRRANDDASGSESMPNIGPSPGTITLVGHTSGHADFEFPDTRDAHGRPFALGCDLPQREFHALTEFGTLSGMSQGYCRFRAYLTPDIQLLIQPFPVEYLPKAHDLLPPFVRVVSRSLSRRW